RCSRIGRGAGMRGVHGHHPNNRTHMITLYRLALCSAAVMFSACGPTTTVARSTGPAPATTTARLVGGIGESIGLQRDVVIAEALGDIDPARIRRIDSALVSFGTRNTFSDTLSSTRGIGAARRWIFSQF